MEQNKINMRADFALKATIFCYEAKVGRRYSGILRLS
tara:strand:+ start:710 stop:820 length:111 start_codon:yes stop_codon:yes gene_type:complete